jgi:hypothetical protein
MQEGGEENWNAAQVSWRYAAHQQIATGSSVLARAAVFLRSVFLLLALRFLFGIFLLRRILRETHSHGTESEGQSEHQRHQFLHRAVLLWIRRLLLVWGYDSEPHMKGLLTHN